MFKATCFDSKDASSGYFSKHICVQGNCAHFWNFKILKGISYKALFIYNKYMLQNIKTGMMLY